MTTVTLPPSVLLQLPETQLPELQTLIVAGEACPKILVERWSFGRDFFNAYGPTETTVCASVFGPLAGSQKPWIGQPLANTRVYVLDEGGHLSPVGVSGELYVGGAGVSRGYLNRGGLTAERFVPDEYGERGGRLYRTGDRVRWSGSGELEYLGRMDQQVKVRGYRIEPGEIEAVLQEYVGVRQSVVIAREDVEGDKRLVAYLVWEAGQRPGGVSELRSHVQRRLPEYMVPSAFVSLECLPLTGNGKLDRKALPAPEGVCEHGEGGYVAPVDAVEEILCGVWEQVLGLERVGVDDNFFELGGHSLLATQVVSRIRDLFQVELPLRVLFEHPTVRGVAAEVETARASHVGVIAPPLLPAERKADGLPLSYAQQRLWFIAQLEPDSAAYNCPGAVRLSGELDVSALERSLAEIVRRHEVLRTSFVTEDGIPVQQIAAASEVYLRQVDLSGLEEERREQETERESEEEARRPFDLSRGPLLRVVLLRLGEREHVLLVTMHHVVSDGWSVGVLIRELGILYAAYRRGEESPLSELPIQYADFAQWQREWLQGEVLEEQLGYWREQLEGVSMLELPLDHVRPSVPSRRGGHVVFRLSGELTERLRLLSQREGVTMFMTLLAGFELLLGRYANQTDVVVGTDVANRTRQEVEGLIGFFVNQLVLRVDLSRSRTFRELLQQVRERTLGAYEHQDLPFEKLVEELAPERDLSRGPLFQVKLVLQNMPQERLELPGLELDRFSSGPDLIKVDLHLLLSEKPEGIVGRMEYASDLFERTTVERMLCHFQVVLEQMVEEPGGLLTEVSLVSQSERKRMLGEWNRTERLYGAVGCVHELFEVQAERRPDAVAVVYEGETLSYGELNGRANQLGRYLRELGVGPEVRVGLCLERGLEMVVGILGVLKAGGCYVPLDPASPVERLSFMMEDTQTPVLLTQEHLRDRLPVYWSQLLCLDAEWDQIAQQASSNLERWASAENLAYVIYTSGTTGRPKGVEVEHRQISNYSRAIAERAGLVASDQFGWISTFTADLGNTMLFCSLCEGATLHLIGAERMADGGRYGEYCAKHGVDVLKITPSHLRGLLASGAGWEILPSRRLILGGEGSSWEWVEGLRAQKPGCEIYNHYGPTECTVGTLSCALPSGQGRVGGVPLGQPLANTRVYVLDEAGQLCPVGVSGELYVGGAGVSRGYLNRPGLTAERFVPDEYGERGGRLYRTGDRVRWSGSGELEYLSRMDQQVKVRGYRIEPGEIEAVLQEYVGVRQSVVIAREDVEGDKRLVAYLVWEAGQGAGGVSELRSHVQRRLPEYMVPSAFVSLECLPLTGNGKLDRKALPAPEGVCEHGEGGYVAPVDAVEEILCGVWEQVLGLERVGVDDNFFELGGHSLLATQVVSRIRDLFQVELPLRVLFEHPTVRGVAAEVETARASHVDVIAPPLLPAERRGQQLPLSYAQERLWFLDQLGGGKSTEYNVPGAVRLNGELDIAALQKTINTIVARHESLRTHFREIAGKPEQVIEPELRIAIPVEDLCGFEQVKQQERLREIMEEEARHSFDLSCGPLVRLKLLRLAEREHILLRTMHHIVSDGWSQGVFNREFTVLYESYQQGRDNPLKPLPVQYADFALWQRRWLENDLLEEQLKYWKTTLSGAPALLNIPTDRMRPARQNFEGGFVEFAVDAGLTAALKALSRRHGMTLYMTLLSAWAILLARLSGQNDLVIGSPVANRRRSEIEGLIGFFVNTLPVRIDLSGSPTVAEVLRRVRGVVLLAQQYQDLPFEQAVEALQPERTLSHSPLFQAMLVWNNEAAQTSSLPGIDLNPLATSSQTAKFDLTLTLREAGGYICGSMVYATALFEHETIGRHLSYLAAVLKQMAADETQSAQQLSLMGDAEWQRVVYGWNKTAAEYPSGKCIHELFEEQAAISPDSIAFLFEDQKLTYRELNRRANRLARHLRQLGVRANDRVGIYLERDLDLIVALLGTLKAGAAYVPLDPAYPLERLKYMIQDASPVIVLTQGPVEPLSGKNLTTTQVLDLGNSLIWSGASPDNLHPMDVGVTSDHPAYVIYTSGSTGRPKGVTGSHRATVNRMAWMHAQYPFQPGEVSCAKASLNFVDSVWELFGALVKGIPTALMPRGLHEDLSRFVLWLTDKQVTRLTLVPSLLRAILSSHAAGHLSLPKLKYWICSGESLPATLANRLLEQISDGTLINLYGSSEDAGDVTFYEVKGPVVTPLVPIGRPIANTRVYILDEDMQPVPTGIAGQIHIAGVQVSEGYPNHPQLTRERFAFDPFTNGSKDRMFSTGDLGRWLADGTIEFLGRTDEQVKIRGHRIEPGEIEAVLQEYVGVRQSVVIAREDVEGDKRLVAYLVWEAGQGAGGVSELRSHVQRRLPEYMVPSAFVSLECLPLTGNGKLDRRALPAPEYVSREEFRAPRTPQEEILCGVWEQVLGVERVGVDDNFFDLGGHSLLATQVVSRIRDPFQVELPLRVLFEHPTVRGVAAEVETARVSHVGVIAPPLLPAERKADGLPLSYAQQRLWFIAQLEPDSAAYNCPVTVRLNGELDIAALQTTINTIVARHESLRTHFREIAGKPEQVIEPELRIVIPVEDLCGIEEARQQLRIREVMEEEARSPFDLSRGPLLRVKVLKLGEQEHILLRTMHHIVSDGWSQGVFNREFTVLYESYQQRRDNPLKPLPVQYADFALWQRRWLENDLLEEQLKYWKTTLSGAPALLNIPTDRMRPARQNFEGGFVEFAVDAGLTAALKALSRRHGMTLYMTLLSAWAILLARLSGQNDLVIGSPVANRRRSEIEGLIGFFVNTLPVRIDLSGSPTVAEVLRRVRGVVLLAQQYQDLPFEQAVEALQPERTLSHSPLFQAMLVWNNEAAQTSSLPGIDLNPLATSSQTAKFDLTLTLREAGGYICGSMVYATALFEHETIGRHLSYLAAVLKQMAADETQSAQQLSLMGDAEWQRVVYGWNKTAAEYPSGKCIHELFEEQAAISPDSIAFLFEDQKLTYRELNRRANRLARHLRQLGVRANDRVGIYLERDLDLIVALLGTLKAGAAYVPLDPAYPLERLKYMIQDASPVIVLTQGPVEPLSGKNLTTTQVLDLGNSLIWSGASPDNLHPMDVGVTSDHPAYVIYTSGSTGRPKGVTGSHRATVNRMAWMHAQYPFQPGEVSCAKASLNFVDSVWELFGALVKGIPTALMPRGLHEDLSRFVLWLTDKQVTRLTLVPSLLRAILSSHAAGHLSLPKLKYWICSGESLPATLANRLLEQISDGTLINLYGSSEDAGDVTFYEVKGPVVTPLVPIGRPIANTRVYILDEDMQPVPTGIAGQIHIAGVQVSEGYPNHPQLTRERFAFDPFTNGSKDRMFSTGDLGRWLADGTIEFLGRTDEQVKIRGHRIEPGEIEAVLQEYVGVRQSVVIAREDVEGDKRLVAYLVWEAGQGAGGVSELRSHVQRRLPEYMVPSAFVSLESLPLTGNGKLDRRALPAPEYVSREEFWAPRTPQEEILAGVWEQVLRVERVGVEDNFFALGGHSLLATQVVSRIRDLFQVELPLRVLFEHPTVRGVAAEVETARASHVGVIAPPLLPAERKADGLPLSYAQQRLWFIAQLEPDSAAYNCPGAVRLSGELDVSALERSLAEIVRRHEVLRTSFVTEDGIPVQQIAAASEVYLRQVDLSGLEEERREQETERESEEEARRPFDLSRGPLLRVVLLRLGEREHVLLVTMHHVVSDGWSVGVLIRELGILYAAYRRGEESPLSELPIQYADFAQWQREWLQGEVLEEQLGYWREQLEGVSMLELPLDHVRPSVPSRRGGHVVFRLSGELTERLRLLSQREGVTMFMTLLAGFELLLGRYANQTDVVVGTDVANRTRQEVEGLIGFFVNQLVLRVDLSRSRTFRELLQQVRERTLGAYEHQDLPFEKLVEELAPERDLSRGPLFQVNLVLQNMPQERLELSGLELSFEKTESQTAKFDLTLITWDTSEGIVGRMEYASDLFERTTVERMLCHFQVVLEQMVEEPGGLLTEVSLVSQSERERMLGEWNRTERLYGAVGCVHELFEVQAERRPDAVAVVYEGETLSYGELNGRANQLGRYLRELGVGPEVRVGLCLERGLEMVVGILGVLKAGGCYVPLDPASPVERLSFMVEDTQTPVLLTQEHLRDQLPKNESRVLCLDAEWDQIAQQASSNLERWASAENLAYVIYTSGTTGRPKGVCVQHEALNNHMQWILESFAISHTDKVLQRSPVYFDASVWEFFAPLLAGGSLVIHDRSAHFSARTLTSTIRDQQVTVMQTVPSILDFLVREADFGLCTSLRWLFSGGELLRAELRNSIREVLPKAGIVNLYGPTEACIDSSFYVSDKRATGSIPIGQPLANTRVYVLDEAGQLCPVGVSGELYVGGAGVSRGYLNRPSLTAERFVPDEYGERGGRLYRTGDRVRWSGSGELEYLGRMDEQVKVRGYRIEPGEVEAALRQQRGVRDAVVVAREGESGQKRLVGYVVGEAGASLDGVEIRRRLGERLPEYMVPSVVVELETFPLTANGKLDRRALPEPSGDRPRGGEYVAPRTVVEELLCGIWSRVLGVERVGVEDNFFALGGDSILSIQIVSQGRQAGIELSVQQIFRSQTVGSLAGQVSVREGVEEEAGSGAVALTPIQEWFFEQGQSEPWHFNQSVLLRVPAGVSAELVESALAELVGHHDALRLRFKRSVEGKWEQSYSTVEAAGGVLLERVDMRGRGVEAWEREASRLQRSLHLERGPLLRAGWFELGEQQVRLLLVIHHLVVDGVSWRILLEDLQQLCRSGVSGEGRRLPARSSSYGRWSLALQEYAGSEALQREAGYWSEVEQGEVVELPRDRRGGENRVSTSARVHVQLNEEETRELLQEAPRAYRTQIQEVLLTALGRSLCRWSGGRSLYVELEGHGREEIFAGVDVSRTVGWFTTIYPVHVRLTGGGIGEDLKAVKEQLRSVPGRGLGYGVLRYLDRSVGSRRAEVVFNYLGQFDQVLTGGSWQRAGETRGAERGAGGYREHLLSVNSMISDGCLHASWEYSAAIHEASTMQQLGESWAEELRALLAHCRASEGGYTPSDFPLVSSLSSDELEELVAELRSTEKVHRNGDL